MTKTSFFPMLSLLLGPLLGLSLSVVSMNAGADAKVDAAAPAFTEKDAAGVEHSLGGLKGKWVVLEWYNKDCPYVKKHYGQGNMQALQKKYVEKGVSWLTVISSAKGKQGHQTPAEAITDMKLVGSKATALLLDEDGSMGKLFGAKTTPHMFVISPDGQLKYAGAIDSNDSSDPATIASATNYVATALDAAMAGKPVPTKSSKAYGCSVKY